MMPWRRMRWRRSMKQDARAELEAACRWIYVPRLLLSTRAHLGVDVRQARQDLAQHPPAVRILQGASIQHVAQGPAESERPTAGALLDVTAENAPAAPVLLPCQFSSSSILMS